MVDLVKIRKKKAEKKKEEEAQAAAETVQPEAGDPVPSARHGMTREGGAGDASTPLGMTREGGAGDASTSLGMTRSAPQAGTAPETPNPQPPTGASRNKLEDFKREAGKRREIENSIARTEAATEEQLELLTFVIAGEQYAVDIERIVEIVTPRPVTRIPNADPSIVGIISLRGTIVTLVDVRRKLRHAAAGEATADTRIVVIDFHHEMVGFIVDRVLRVVKTSRRAIEPHPVVHANELDESIRGVFRPGGALTILLDLDKLLDHTALAARSA